MSRLVSSTNETEAAKPAIMMVAFVDLDFASGHVRANDSALKFSFGGNDYLGVGTFGGFEQVAETLDVVARSLKLTLSGIPGDLVPDLLTENYQGRAATVYLGFVDQRTMSLVDTPETVWTGQMDKLDVEDGADGATVTLLCENDLYIEPLAARYTDQDQQIRYSGDTFFDCLYMIPLSRSTWGAATQSYAGGGGGGNNNPGSGNGPVFQP